MDILLSLKPVYAQAILSGKKRYEFRRAIFKNPSVKKAYIYATAPVSKIVGVFAIGKILSGTPIEIWQKCKKHAGITADAFFKYYQDCQTAFAIQIRCVQNFLKQLDPYLKLPNFRPPQSFCYVREDVFTEKPSLESRLMTIYRTLSLNVLWERPKSLIKEY